jgi:glutaminyl-tRNA synthetase
VQWVSAEHALDAEVRLYDSLFTDSNPGEDKDGREFTDYLNPDSLEVLTSCKVEPFLAEGNASIRYQFLRMGYFCIDSRDSSGKKLIFNRIVGLKDTWAKVSKE